MNATDEPDDVNLKRFAAGMFLLGGMVGVVVGLYVGDSIGSDREMLRFAKWCDAPGYYRFEIDSAKYRIVCAPPQVTEIKPWE